MLFFYLAKLFKYFFEKFTEKRQLKCTKKTYAWIYTARRWRR